MSPANDFALISSARDEKRARLAAKHAGIGASTINPEAASAAPPAVTDLRPVSGDGRSGEFPVWWVLTGLVIGFLSGWFSMFLVVVSRGCGQ